MAKLLKLRRGTTSQHSSFTGAEGEVTVDTTKDTLVVHDGSTAGGVPLAKESILIDEDNMSSNSATRLPSQQSVKAYVDGKVPTSITVADESSDTTCFPLFVTAATGDLAPKTGSNFTFNSSTGKVVIGGDLQVQGTTTTVDSTTMSVADKNIELAKGAANDAAADGGGITLVSGDGNKEIKWVDSTNSWTFNQTIETTGAIKGNSIITSTGSLGVGTHSITSPNSVNRSIHVHDSAHSSLVLSDDQNTWEVVSNNDLTVRDGTDTRLTINTTGNATFAGTVSDSKGNVRSIPQNTQGSAYTLVAADAGKHILASGDITVPNSVFSAGDAVTIVNNTAGDLTLYMNITTRYKSADGSSGGNFTLATRGMATLLFASGTVCYGSGAGLS